ncbi:MAG: UDP-3-O-(3-hydroxymyristoyl)glucosamine N-acyltransferase [Planctomycetota bacterium]
MASFTAQSIATHVEGRLVGDAEVALTGLGEIGDATAGQLTFVGEAGYAPRWAASGASAALVTEGIELEPSNGRALIFVDNADLAMAKILELLAPEQARPEPGVHPTAIIDGSAEVADDATVGPYCVIGPRVRVGSAAVLHNHVTLLDDAVVGDRTVLFPNVVIRERCTVGARCVFEPGCVIGADGFGYRPDSVDGIPRIVKVPHLGHVEIGSDVELGANVTIDRGKFDATTIGQGTKIDNQTQIGHNCKIGNLVVMSGCVGMAGSVKIGDGSLIGGGVQFRDHVTLGRGCKVAGTAVVAHDMPDGEEWAGVPAGPAKDYFREFMAVRKLPAMLKEFKTLKQRVDKLANTAD